MLRPTLSFGRIGGVPSGAHWSVGLIAFVLTSTLAGTVLPTAAPGRSSVLYLAVALATALAFLGSILAHEYGHALTARSHGIGVRSIVLYALGGVATLNREPTDPSAGMRIALAGPAVSVAIGGGSLGLAVLLGAIGDAQTNTALAAAAIAWLGLVNLMLAGFNLLPALPLDGGRALQALLWRRRGDRDSATVTAARLGRFTGSALMLFGLWQALNGRFGLITLAIGWYITQAAAAEGRRAELNRRRSAFGADVHAAPTGAAPPPGVIDTTAREL